MYSSSPPYNRSFDSTEWERRIIEGKKKKQAEEGIRNEKKPRLTERQTDRQRDSQTGRQNERKNERKKKKGREERAMKEKEGQ